ncbi:hypothetical protein [Thiospirillum jenense]|nr:hypothetical protein [Thiospirillum jenense]
MDNNAPDRTASVARGWRYYKQAQLHWRSFMRDTVAMVAGSHTAG